MTTPEEIYKTHNPNNSNFITLDAHLLNNEFRLHSPVIKVRRNSNNTSPAANNTITRNNNSSSNNGGYKKMNKVPYREAVQQKINAIYDPLLRRGELSSGGKNFHGVSPRKHSETHQEATKHSAHMVHRHRIPPIAQHIKIQADMNRLNLKTGGELIGKKTNTGLGMVNSHPASDSFDVSVDIA